MQWDQARASVAFLWDQHPWGLAEAIGELARIAPLPETAGIFGAASTGSNAYYADGFR